MKRYLFLFIVLSAGLTSYAQRTYQPYVWYYAGGRIGADLFQYKTDNPHKTIPYYNYNISGWFGYCYSYYTEFRIGAEIADRSVGIDYKFPNVLPEDFNKIPDRIDWGMTYLTVPLTLNQNLIHGMYGKWYVSLGISPELRLRLNEHTTFMNKDKYETFNFQFNGDFNRFAFSAFASTGVRIRIYQVYYIDIEPWYRYALRPVHSELLKPYPAAYGASLGFGVEW